MKFYQTIGFVLLIALVLVQPAYAAQADASAQEMFQLGTKAFENNKYDQAIDYFQQARRQGLNTPALHYNLGVAYFKSGLLNQAEKEFQTISRSEGYIPLAHYNLGLIALRKGKKQSAASNFRVTLRNTENTNLRKLADRQLEKIAPVKQQPRTWWGYYSFAGGYDDNVTLDEDSQIQGNTGKDAFGEIVASATGQLTGTRQNGVQLKLNGYYLDYLDTDRYDFASFRIGPEIDRKLGEWDTSLGGFVSWEYIDREVFERLFSTELATSRQITSNLELNLEYRLDLINASSNYDYLSGNRHSFTSELRYLFLGTYTGWGYTLQLNDRNYSDYPTRHSIHFFAERDLTASWSADVSASYRYSNYGQTHRSDKRIWLSSRVSRSIPFDLRVFAKYDYINNISNLQEDEYTSNIFTLGLERFF